MSAASTVSRAREQRSDIFADTSQNILRSAAAAVCDECEIPYVANENVKINNMIRYRRFYVA